MSEKKIINGGIGTIAVHGGHVADPTAAHLTPIYATSTFTFDTAEQGMRRFAGEENGYIYSRWGNPSFTEAEEKIAALEAHGLTNEDGQPLQLKALLHASGQAAMTTLFLSVLQNGDKVLSHYSLYGGTYELLHRVLPPMGIEPIIQDLRNPNVVEAILANNPSIKWIHLETPANPTLQCVDIAGITAIAKRFQVGVSVDNTFATPFLQQPFQFGVDYVFHSTTKFLNGHGTAIGGILIGRDIQRMNTQITKWHRLLGGNSNPFDAFLLVNGLKTLEVRMERHCSNAEKVAQFLAQHPAVVKVNYTGLPSHPNYELVKRQMRHPGPMLSFECKGGLPAGKKFINALQLCTRAVSLGTTDTLISHPASMTHFGVSKEEKEKFDITDGLIRVSVGIETVEDIIRDLSQALNASQQ